MQHKLNILLIEDNKSDQRIIASLLDEAGVRYNLLKADTLNEGIEFLISSNVDIILLDLGLPDSSGYKTIQKIINSNHLIPVIVLTGTQNSIIESLAIKVGAQEYLTKEKLKSSQLIKTIQNSILRNNNVKKLNDVNKDLNHKTRAYNEVLELTTIGHWTMDMVSNLMDWSKEVYQIFNFQPESLQPTLSLYLKYVHNDDKLRVSSWFNNLSSAVQKTSIKHKLVVSGTTIIHVKLNARFSFEDANQPLRIIGSIQNISDDLSVYEDNQKNHSADEQLLKSFFESTIFNIKTPINTIHNVGYLIGQTHLAENQKELMDQILYSVEELVNTTYEISGLLQLSNQNPKIITSRTYLKSIITQLSNKFKAAAIDESLIKDLNLNDQIEFFPDVYSIFLNMLDLFLIASGVSNRPLISLNTSKSGNILNICFKIDLTKFKDISAKKFDFNLTENPGLKLTQLLKKENLSEHDLCPIISWAVTLLKGNISVNKTGLLNNLVIDLQFNVLKSENKLDQKQNNLDDLKIMVVDDHFLNRLSAKKTLQNHFKNSLISEAENGNIAVEKAKSMNLDIILMDIQMPVMDGIQATAHIKDFSNAIIIGMSAGEIENGEQILLQRGFNDFIIKPFKAQDLIQKITYHLSGSYSKMI